MPSVSAKPRRALRWVASGASVGAVGGLGALVLGSEAARAQLLQGLRSAGAHLLHSTSLPNWSIYLLSACALACAWQVRRLGRPVLRRTPPPLSPEQYTSDRFLNVQWHWRLDERQRPRQLWASCPDCATRLVSFTTKPPEERRTKLFCEHCRRIPLSEAGDRDYLFARVARQVERKLRTGEWQDSQRSLPPPSAHGLTDDGPPELSRPHP